MASPPASTLSGLRDFFARSEKDTIPADLMRALALLQLDGLDALEERFLATDAFLKPWSVFRDSVLLLWPDAMPNITPIKNTASETGIACKDVLWFYTQFDEGTKRYDARADRYSLEYTPDSSLYGVINKNGWSIEAYEKHMYAWLFQAFRVGKGRNALGFSFFELQSAAVAWEKAFVPIINAVRASYDVKGRHFYGRLALFVESKCPSRLAFPENNVGITKTELISPTPFRVVSVPKKMAGSDDAAFIRRLNGPGVLTKKHYDETEKELRDVYPMYGGLVERPRFKQKMEEWLAEQRRRADARKVLEQHREVRNFQPQIVQHIGERSQTNTALSNGQDQRESPHNGGPSPIKRTFDSIRRSISNTVSKGTTKELPKSPLHGVTRQLYFPDEDPPNHSHAVQKTLSSLGRERSTSLDSSDRVDVIPWPGPETRHQASERSVYASIRGSNPFTGDVPAEKKVHNPPAPVEHPERQANGQPGSILRLLRDEEHHAGQSPTVSRTEPSVRAQKSLADVRLPSYEGTGYGDEISPTKLHAGLIRNDRTPTPGDAPKPLTRLPVPIKPAAYNGPLRVAHREPIIRSPPEKVPWPGFEGDKVSKPAVPAKSPERAVNKNRRVSESRPEQGALEDSRNVTRIVSKANIRAAIGSVSREGSIEDLALPVRMPYADGPARTLSPGGSKLHTYNTHLFPRKERKDTSLGAWAVEHGKRYEAGGQYEMKVLKSDPEGPQGGRT
ncbi:hypothetical protein T440DRAFT_535908 [Plenodomus tracheiphilus IPT5]|uniref:Uncharacterized protein n=1 Tax=Plenodomus tracheiphilus IPT5 TaxID=1408161 RepID=A0A6A7BMT6_9PLEO|nr:hypothetical protein T440DRAFT_535908 [Plenodomus tracheiphilus IPT5]